MPKPSPSDIRITPQRLEILRICNNYKRVSSAHVFKLVDGNPRVIYRNLKLLSENNFISKKYLPERYFNLKRESLSPFSPTSNMFGIGDRGLSVLAASDGLSVGKRRPATTFKKTTKDFDTHELLLTDFLVGMQEKCKKSKTLNCLYPYPSEFIAKLPEKTRLKYRSTHSQNAFGWKVKTKWAGKPMTLPYYPDFFLPIEDTKTGKTNYYLVEIDTGTETIIPESYAAYDTMLNNRSILRKMVAIHESWLQRLPQKHLGTSACQVLFVTTTERKIELFREALELTLKVTKPKRKARGLFKFSV